MTNRRCSGLLFGYLSYSGWEKEFGWLGICFKSRYERQERDRLFTLFNPPERKCSVFTCFDALILDSSPTKIK